MRGPSQDISQNARNEHRNVGGWVFLKNDLPASIVVFLVALPLCMGIAIASGAPPATGLITGIVGGILVGVFAGAPLQVSGPAAGLSVMVYEIVTKEGMEVLGMSVLVAGCAQLVAGLLGWGQWFRAVSPAVIRGMLAGIGVLIFASQFHVMVDDAPRSTGLQNIVSLPEAIVKGVTPTDDSTHHQAAFIGLLTIAVIALWKPIVPGRLKALPAPLMAVVIGTVASVWMQFSINLVSIPDSLLDAVRFPGLSEWALLMDGKILLAGLAIAFVASAETLLCATAVDQMHQGPRTKYDRELFAQGVGNTVCGFLGALPMTGVIVRSAANVESGARTRASAFLHGVWILIFAAAMPFVLRAIPTACLAAVLVYTGYKLVDRNAIKNLLTYGRSEVAIYAATVLTIVIADLLTGVLVGVGLSVMKLLMMFSHLEVRMDENIQENRTNVYLRGAATFVRLPRLAQVLDRVRPSTELHVHLERLDYIDHACLDLLMNWEKTHESTGGRLVIDWDFLTAKFHRAEENSNSGLHVQEPLDRSAPQDMQYEPAAMS